MEKIELKHLAPYLPYGLKMTWSDGKINVLNPELDEIDYSENEVNLTLVLFIINKGHNDIKPILRPLSDLTEEITHKGKTFIPAARMITHGFHNSFWYEIDKFDYRYLYAMDFEKLLEWHFDVFGLIDAGLAIDINTLK